MRRIRTTMSSVRSIVRLQRSDYRLQMYFVCHLPSVPLPSESGARRGLGPRRAPDLDNPYDAGAWSVFRPRNEAIHMTFGRQSPEERLRACPSRRGRCCVPAIGGFLLVPEWGYAQHGAGLAEGRPVICHLSSDLYHLTSIICNLISG